MAFTKEQILEISRKLKSYGKKDSEFIEADPLSGSETIAVVQDGTNKNITLEQLKSYITSGTTPVTPTVTYSVSLSPDVLNLDIGAVSQVTASLYPAGATIKSVTWSSSNPAVASVSSSGYVTAKAVGTASITAVVVTSDDSQYTGSLSVYATKATDTDKTLSSVRITLDKSTIEYNGSTGYTVTAYYSDGTTADVTDSAAVSASSDKVTVTASHTIVGANAGTSTGDKYYFSFLPPNSYFNGAYHGGTNGLPYLAVDVPLAVKATVTKVSASRTSTSAVSGINITAVLNSSSGTPVSGSTALTVKGDDGLTSTTSIVAADQLKWRIDSATYPQFIVTDVYNNSINTADNGSKRGSSDYVYGDTITITAKELASSSNFKYCQVVCSVGSTSAQDSWGSTVTTDGSQYIYNPTSVTLTYTPIYSDDEFVAEGHQYSEDDVLYDGQSIQLNAVVTYPDGTTNSSVQYTIADGSDYLTVDQSTGIVTCSMSDDVEVTALIVATALDNSGNPTSVSSSLQIPIKRRTLTFVGIDVDSHVQQGFVPIETDSMGRYIIVNTSGGNELGLRAEIDGFYDGSESLWELSVDNTTGINFDGSFTAGGNGIGARFTATYLRAEVAEYRTYTFTVTYNRSVYGTRYQKSITFIQYSGEVPTTELSITDGDGNPLTDNSIILAATADSSAVLKVESSDTWTASIQST